MLILNNDKDNFFRYINKMINAIKPLIFTTIMTTIMGVVFGSLNIVTVSSTQIISLQYNIYDVNYDFCIIISFLMYKIL